MRPTAVLFDIDGTLLSCGGASGSAFDRAFEELFGVACASSGVVKSGRTDFAITQDAARRALGRELASEEIDVLNRRYSELLDKELHCCSSFEVLPGVTRLLARLGALRITLGVQTGNSRPAARVKLRRAGLDQHFAFGGYCQGVVERIAVVETAVRLARETHQELALDRIFVVGDTPHDIRAAQQVGVVPIAVCTGRFTAGELEAVAPAHLFETLENLDPFCRAVGFADSG